MRHVMVKDGVVVQAMMLDLESEGGQEWLANNEGEYDHIIFHETADVGDIYEDGEFTTPPPVVAVPEPGEE